MELKLERGKPHIRLVGSNIKLRNEMINKFIKEYPDAVLVNDMASPNLVQLKEDIRESIKQSKLIKYTTSSYPDSKAYVINNVGDKNGTEFRSFLGDLEKLIKVSQWTQVHVIFSTDTYTSNRILESQFDVIYEVKEDGIFKSINIDKGDYLNMDVIGKLKELELKQGRLFTFNELKESLAGKTRELDTHTEVVNGIEYLLIKKYITRESEGVYKIIIDTLLW